MPIQPQRQHDVQRWIDQRSEHQQPRSIRVEQGDEQDRRYPDHASADEEPTQSVESIGIDEAEGHHTQRAQGHHQQEHVPLAAVGGRDYDIESEDVPIGWKAEEEAFLGVFRAGVAERQGARDEWHRRPEWSRIRHPAGVDQEDDRYECVVDVVDDVGEPCPINLRRMPLDVDPPGQRSID